MKKKTNPKKAVLKKGLLTFLCVLIGCLVGGSLSGMVYALDFSGESGSGDETGRRGPGSGYALVHATPTCNANSIIGYRFSVYDYARNKRGKTIDVYRSGCTRNGSVCSCTGSICAVTNRVTWSQFGYYGYSLVEEDGLFLDKLENKASYKQNKGFSLKIATKNKYLETMLEVKEYFPVYTKLYRWLQESQNTDVIIELCLGPGQELNYGDMLLVEPIFCCFVAHLSCGLTVSDLARIGYSYYGDVFPESVSGAYEFAWIRTWVYKTFPNMLSVTDYGKAMDIGLKAGTKLKEGSKPSALMEGAYGMVLCTQMSKSTEPPELKIEGIAIYTKEGEEEKLVNSEEYLIPGQEYILKIQTKEETSNYLCQRNVVLSGAMTQTFTSEAYSDSPWEINFVLGNNDKELCITISEDWISEAQTCLKKGEKESWEKPLRPLIETKLKFLDSLGQEIREAYYGQKVTMIVEQTNLSPWANEEYVYETRIQFCQRKDCIDETTQFTLSYLETKEIQYEVIMENEGLSCEYQVESVWKNTGSEMAKETGTLPLYQAELEILGITWMDDQDNLLNPNSIPVGKNVFPVLHVRTNAKSAIDIVMESALDGNKNEELKTCLTQEVESIKLHSMVCETEKEYLFDARVYLSGIGEEDSVEEEEYGCTKEVTLTAIEPLVLTTMEQKNVFMGEDVLSAIQIANHSYEDFKGETKVWMKIVKANGEIVHTDSVDLICPKGETNYLTFVWTVPKDLTDGETLSIEYECMLFENEGTVKKYQTELTARKGLYTEQENTSLKAPEKLETMCRLAQKAQAKYGGLNSASGEKTWTIWSLEDDEFTKDEYRLVYTLNSQIVDADRTKKKEDGTWTVKSGYSITYSSEFTVTIYKNKRKVSSANCVKGEGHITYLYFENCYQEKEGLCSQFYNEAHTVKHYIPVWAPDGNYLTLAMGSGIWTPVGEAGIVTKIECEIKGSIFDDYFVTQ